MGVLRLMTRIESFAANALRGLLASRTTLGIKGEIAMSWRYAEGMEAEAKRRELTALASERPEDMPVTITASYVFALALTEGYEAAVGAGFEFTNRERRLIREVLEAYGTAESAGALSYGRCELTHRFCEVAQFAFPPKESSDAD